MKEFDISVRMKHVIRSSTEESRRFKRLEDELGVSASSWKSWWHGRQRATEEMIHAVCKRWPQYAFWITTGIDDAQYGHAAPAGDGFPSDGDEQPSSTRYFTEVIALRDAAIKHLPEWLDTDDAELNHELASDDALLRAIVADTHFAAKLLIELKQRVEIASKLRNSEIVLHGDMPDMDYDETAVVIRAVERALNKAISHTSAPADMEGEIAARAAAIEKLKQRVSAYQRAAQKRES